MWGHILDRAGILTPETRRAYTAQRRAVRRFAPAEYAAARLLLPARLQPDAVVLVSFMHETDDRIDRGPRADREEALRQWRHLVEEALDGGRPALPVLRTLAHAVARHPALRDRVKAFLDGAELEVSWDRFASETDLERYIEGYSLPALMLSMSLLSPATEPASTRFEDGCLALISAMQRLDFLEDIAEDAEEGRVGVPTSALDRYGLVIRNGRLSEPRPGAFKALVTDQTDRAARSLTAARHLVDLAAHPDRPFLRAFLRVQHLRLTAVRKAGPTLMTHPCGPSRLHSCAVLLQESTRRRRETPPATLSSVGTPPS
ncbi:squalene/phytoene synthase family protein [Streptomyces sp. NPDC094032]|uniref:squalene/phytoene synthase family protein n=1 Tax=Streptomyces sp. NPDC094032 TaxID=3155308 RepID=UPI0033210C69